MVEKKELLSVFQQLRKTLELLIANETWPGFESGLTESEFTQFKSAIAKEQLHNPWFTPENYYKALRGIVHLLEPVALEEFSNRYTYANKQKRVAIIMAGNIPFVGFHDLLCVLLAGHHAICKLSSLDARIPLLIIQLLQQWNANLKERISVSVGPLKAYDAVIATGSNATIQQLESYFSHVPRVFRRNRTSVAILNGQETDDELRRLGEDCFDFFGLGCRNVSKLYVPQDFNLNRLFENFSGQSSWINHHKYGNNYDYNRTVYLMNQIPFLDNNAFMLKEDSGLHAPLSVIYYEKYESLDKTIAEIEALSDELQAIVGAGFVPFGKAQSPDIHDFADGFDTCKWLNNI